GTSTGRRALRRYSPWSPGAGGHRMRRRRSGRHRRVRRESPTRATIVHGRCPDTSRHRKLGRHTRDKRSPLLAPSVSPAPRKSSYSAPRDYFRGFGERPVDRADLVLCEPDAPALRVRSSFGPCQLRGMGCSMPTRLPSVSVNETYWPTPGISIGSPSTLPPASTTYIQTCLLSSTT